MKKFLAISFLLSLLACGKCRACIFEPPTYNYYMMRVCPRTNAGFEKRANRFWQEYSNWKCDSYLDYQSTIREIATEREDHEILAYMDELDRYLKICDQLKERWSYPTAQELAARKTTLQQIAVKCKAYKDTRLEPQYALLLMRVQMLLGQYDANIQFWTGTARKMRPSVYRGMMENIYANALLNTGKKLEALDIYATQGDWVSINWGMREHRNFAGIKALYEKNPNSPVLVYLVEDFVNNVQETIDDINASKSEEGLFGEDLEGWIEDKGHKPVYDEETSRFVAFANDVIKEGKTQYPCLWQTAIGTITYLSGDPGKALGIMEKAITMDGTDIMKDNARCVWLICAATVNKLSQQYENFLAEELTWLDSKIYGAHITGTDDLDDTGYYLRMKERLVHRTLIPKYRAEGRFEMAAYLLDMIERQTISDDVLQAIDENGDFRWNREYSTLYFECLDKLSADSLVLYKTNFYKKPAGSLERYLKDRVYRSEAYYNDLIGTKMIAEGRFEEAIPYLEKVPLKFLRKQNICMYMATCDYSRPRWFVRQAVNYNEIYDPEFRTLLAKNQKLDFCREMIRLKTQYDSSRRNSKERLATAYEMAVRYFQASCYGDCWYLTHYGLSSGDSARVGEKDFARAAIEYLSECKNSKDFNMRQQSLYALAYIPTEPYMEYTYDMETYDLQTVFNKSRQYFALKELDDFATANPGKTSRYVSSCDVLRKFREKNKTLACWLNP